MNQHPVKCLFDDIPNFVSFPESLVGVKPVPEQIQGTSFFPGGVGLYCKDRGVLPQFPVGGVMVLGHDFHSEVGYEQSLQRGAEDMCGQTWRHLLKFLSRVPICLDRCFFTNVYMGLRVGDIATGEFPGAKSEQFVTSCRRFFLHQVSLQRPSLILALGSYVPVFLAPLSPALAPWAKTMTFRERDSTAPLVKSVTFDTLHATPCVVVSMVHPCLRPSNIRHRRTPTASGDAFELSLVKEALNLADQKSGGRLSCST